MGRCETVLQAVSAAGILRHIATDGTYALRGGVGCIEITVRGNSLCHVGVDHTGLYDHTLVGDINFEDAIHTCEADDDSPLRRESTTTEPGTRSTSHKGNSVPGTDAYDRLNLLCTARENNSAWHGAKIGKTIALVGLELVQRSDQSAPTICIFRPQGRSQIIKYGRIQHAESYYAGSIFRYSS